MGDLTPTLFRNTHLEGVVALDRPVNRACADRQALRKLAHRVALVAELERHGHVDVHRRSADAPSLSFARAMPARVAVFARGGLHARLRRLLGCLREPAFSVPLEEAADVLGVVGLPSRSEPLTPSSVTQPSLFGPLPEEL